MGKLLVLYRRVLLTSLAVLAVYLVITLGGLALTGYSLFEGYLYAAPLMTILLPATFTGGGTVHLALSFGASRRLCYWAQQLAMILVALCCLLMTWLAFWMADAWLESDRWLFGRWESALLVLFPCLLVMQGGQLAMTMGQSWQKTLVLVGVGLPALSLILLLEAVLLLENPVVAPLHPVGLQNPVWQAVSVGFAAAAVVLGIVSRLKFQGLVVRL